MAALAGEWLRQDRDPKTRFEIESLLKNQNSKELEKLLSPRLAFGTAGLRARMGAGFARINSLTIIQTSQGLAEYLVHEGNASDGIVIGYDARHNSKKFAEYAAAAFIAKGIPVWWYEDLVHTPMVPFAVRHNRAAAGIMITASHNPAHDNGYKVYRSNGCQINTPADEKIAAFIRDNLEPITWDLTSQATHRKPLLSSMRVSYTQTLENFVGRSRPDFPAFVYTPMHGVGLPFMKAAIGASASMMVVKEQADPDPDFPTVQYPNPEEHGALDCAKAAADQSGTHLIIANDPDADRFAAAEKVDGQWIQFTGDQMGVLLGSFMLESGNLRSGDWALTTAVSSQMLSVMAENAFKIEETLTGFKWLGNRTLELEKQGQVVQFGYEEALGYMFPQIVHDKDGIAAALVFLHACANWGSPWARLQTLYEKFGYFKTMNTYWKSPSSATTVTLFERIRGFGKPHPARVANREVQRWRDLTLRYDSDSKDHRPILPLSSSVHMITCWLGGHIPTDKIHAVDEGIRFTVRASGTEPKVKSKHVLF